MKTLLALIAAVFLSAPVLLAQTGPEAKRVIVFMKDNTDVSALKIKFAKHRVIKKYERLNAALVLVPARQDISNSSVTLLIEEDRAIKLTPVPAGVETAVSTQTRAADDMFGYADALPWGVMTVNAPAAWQKGYMGQGVKIAIIDSGITSSNADLSNRLLESFSFTASAQSPTEHGTQVSGVLAASLNNTGVVGVAPACSLYNIQTVGDDGIVRLSNLVEAIDKAIELDAKLINLSLNLKKESLALKYAIYKAYEKGILSICAAGNGGEDTLSYPARYPFVVSVAAMTIRQKPARFSNRGEGLSFIAPGADILTTGPKWNYVVCSGTSFAAPHVTGLAAIAINAGAQTPKTIMEKLKQAAHKLPGVEDAYQGFGLINADDIR
ncbi:MAG: S8 family serine peptidase [Elusimicrobiaceae bacterium]